jgi:EpsI family protein
MKRWLDIAGATALSAGLLGAFWQPLRSMVATWSGSPMYSHAFTVPAISVGLLWAMRHKFAEQPARPARLAALPVLAVALLMLSVGELAAIVILQQLGFVVMVAGLVLFLFGVAYLRIAAPAVAYLLFMVPFWDAFTEPLHGPFQDNSARLGVALMHLVHVPAFRDGTVIALPNVTIQVARECSGVNYLIAVLALALPLSFLRLRSWRKRVLLVSAAMIISALANGLRVALIGTLAYLNVGSPLHGPFHVLHGLFVAAIGYVVLFVGAHFMEDPARPAVASADRSALFRPSWRRADAFALAAVFWLLVFVGVAPTATPVALAKSLDELPSRFDGWTERLTFGSPRTPTDAWLSADQHLSREYREPSGLEARVDIWYFAEQRQSHEIVSYQVAGLHQRATPRRIELADGTSLVANEVAWPDRGTVGLFWYEIAGLPEAREFPAKLRSIWTVIRSGHSHAAAIMITAAAAPGAQDATLQGLRRLAGDVHTGLAAHWPVTMVAAGGPS